ncbi:MAG: 2-pyrone-4,6-dicarboxylate lactonase [Hyphomicrobiales bacterium]|jgi:predicted TIM-barrel fold metal-dependent hydrolase|nr:2-pyrone-4,6-dicarboxylate lactonase [Hyphomicrobiales bacterium]
MPTYFPFDPNPRVPAVKLPPLACDSQFHVFGPREVYPVRPDAAYEMPAATVAAAMTMHRTLGLQRGVIVQPTTYGADHRATLDGISAAGANYRGCANAAVFESADDAALEKLHAGGIRGARFSRQSLGIALSPQAFDRAVARIRELGWYVKVQPETSGFAEQAAQYDTLDLPVLIDHMGRPNAAAGLDDPSLKAAIELLKRGNFWVMLSLAEKISKAGPPWDDVIPIMRALIEAAPDRVVWASDWPHPVSTTQPPNEADLIELLYRATNDDEERRRILVDNPAKLFGFTPP